MKHKSQKELLKEIKRSGVKIGDRYFHYKNPTKFYSVIAVAFIESSEESCVVYKGEYGEKIVWVREVIDFLSKVSLPNGKKVDRFTKVE